MSEPTVDLDALTARAWREFRGALAEAMEALDPGAYLQVALDAGDQLDGASPYVRALRAGDSILVEVASNRSPSAEHTLSKQARRHLRCLGLAKPTAAVPGWGQLPEKSC